MSQRYPYNGNVYTRAELEDMALSLEHEARMKSELADKVSTHGLAEQYRLQATARENGALLIRKYLSKLK